MGFDEGRIVFDNERLEYFAGQVVYAKVVFDQENVKKFRGMYAKIKGFCDVLWTTRHSRRVNDRTEQYTVEHTSHETYFEQKIYLAGGKDGEVHLPSGHHEFPFQFLIPPHCPSSFEGSDGHIRYEVKVVVDRSFKFDQEKKMQLRVINQKNLNLDPYCKEPLMYEFEETYCCWCMSQGICETTAKVPQAGFCAGQTINIELSVANKSNVEIDVIKIELIENRKYIASHNPDTRHEEKVMAVLKKRDIPGNTTRNWTLGIDIPEMDVYNLDACQYIDINHQLKITVSPSGCHSDSEQMHRVVIGHIPLREFEGPPQGDNVLQPVAPSMAQIQNQPPNFPVPYPGANPVYPGQNPQFPGQNPPPYPGANMPFPNQNSGAIPPYPGVAPQYPGANPPYPGANLPVPSVTPYPIGFTNDPTSPLVPAMPYPPGPATGSPYGNASAPPPSTPDNEGNGKI